MAAATKGNCYICGATLAKVAMEKHIIELHGDDKGGQACRLVKAEGAYPKGYWLYFDVAADKTLSAVDGFLRRIWLECCGHLSEFCLPGDFEIGKSRKLSSFDEGDILIHRYDFGTTTETILTVLGSTTRKQQRGIVRLLARNVPPVFKCKECGEKAFYIAALMDDTTVINYYCFKCGEKIDEDEYFMLHVTNSPRMGQCGYSGELDDFTFYPSLVTQKQAALPPGTN